jgi:hypothetical protein
MAATKHYGRKEIPHCNKCGGRHYNFMKTCPPKPPEVPFLQRQPAPEGFKYSAGWGESTKHVPIIYQLPARHRTGGLIGPDGTSHKPGKEYTNDDS